jgi:hypothetical protein
MSDKSITIAVNQIWEVPCQWRKSGKVQIKIIHIFDTSIWYQSSCSLSCGWTPPYPESKSKFIDALHASGVLITAKEPDESVQQPDIFVDSSIPDNELQLRTKDGETILKIQNLKAT